MVLLGEILDAADALNIGLANRVVADDFLEPAAQAFAERLAAQPPEAIEGARRAIEASWLLQPAASLRLAVQAQARCLRSPPHFAPRNKRSARVGSAAKARTHRGSPNGLIYGPVAFRRRRAGYLRESMVT